MELWTEAKHILNFRGLIDSLNVNERRGIWLSKCLLNLELLHLEEILEIKLFGGNDILVCKLCRYLLHEVPLSFFFIWDVNFLLWLDGGWIESSLLLKFCGQKRVSTLRLLSLWWLHFAHQVWILVAWIVSWMLKGINSYWCGKSLKSTQIWYLRLNAFSKVRVWLLFVRRHSNVWCILIHCRRLKSLIIAFKLIRLLKTCLLIFRWNLKFSSLLYYRRTIHWFVFQDLNKPWWLFTRHEMEKAWSLFLILDLDSSTLKLNLAKYSSLLCFLSVASVLSFKNNNYTQKWN